MTGRNTERNAERKKERKKRILDKYSPTEEHSHLFLSFYREKKGCLCPSSALPLHPFPGNEAKHDFSLLLPHKPCVNLVSDITFIFVLLHALVTH